jgi:hypothetical protein
MIPITEHISYKRMLMRGIWDLINLSHFDPIIRMIPLTVIPLSGAHCSFKPFKLFFKLFLAIKKRKKLLVVKQSDVLDNCFRRKTNFQSSVPRCKKNVLSLFQGNKMIFKITFYNKNVSMIYAERHGRLQQKCPNSFSRKWKQNS